LGMKSSARARCVVAYLARTRSTSKS
jgi:hypothetical protein